MALRKYYISKEELQRLYWHEWLTSFEIADNLGCSAGTVINLMRKYGVRRRNSGPKRIKVRRDILDKFYAERRFSTKAIARIYHCDQGVILRALRRYDITVRQPKQPLNLPRDILEKLYWKRKLSTYKIAEIYKCNSGTVYRYMKLYNIPTRPPRRIILTKTELEGLYINKRLSLKTIAELYRYNAAGVLGKMRKYGIARRTISETSTKHPKKDFTGSQEEKAYMVGFRLGDLGVREGSYQISISSSTTKRAQVKLIKNLFSAYGPVWVGRRNQYGAVNVSCSLNKSFLFLLPKYQRVPRWVLNTQCRFFSFLAGYTDAEGNVGISDGRARFRIRSYDRGILFDCHRTLRRHGIKSLFERVSLAGVDRRGVKHNRDCWGLIINERHSLLMLFSKLQPLLRHGKRAVDLKKAMSNVTMRLNTNPALL